jgi:DNA-binding winged helix-turn-helix (wHTH) protein
MTLYHIRVNETEVIERGIALLKEGDRGGFALYLKEIRRSSYLLASLLDVGASVYFHSPSEAVRKAARLLPRIAGMPTLAVYLFSWLGFSKRMLGEIESSDVYFTKEMETAEMVGDTERVFRARLDILYNRFMKAEFEALYRELQRITKEGSFSDDYDIQYMLAALETIMGRPKRSVDIAKAFLARPGLPKIQSSTMKEVLGFAMRMSGKIDEAFKLYLEATNELIEIGSAYACFPCAKALELSRLVKIGPVPRSTVKRCVRLAREAGGEWAAGAEAEALLLEDSAEASERVFESAQSYYRGYQPIEALTAGAVSAYLAWISDAPCFTKIIKFLRPLIRVYPHFRDDPILGEFMQGIEPLMEIGAVEAGFHGIRANLIGRFRLFVDDKEITTQAWGRKKAVLCLVYLLLSPKHRIPNDHLFYLLWPREKYGPRTRRWLYNLITTIRKNLGKPDLLTMKGDFYQLESVWTDLGEIENLIRLADSSREPAEKEGLLSRARELAMGELLPEFPYDRYIDEYRQYYERLRKKLTQK